LGIDISGVDILGVDILRVDILGGTPTYIVTVDIRKYRPHLPTTGCCCCCWLAISRPTLVLWGFLVLSAESL